MDPTLTRVVYFSMEIAVDAGIRTYGHDSFRQHFDNDGDNRKNTIR